MAVDGSGALLEGRRWGDEGRFAVRCVLKQGPFYLLTNTIRWLVKHVFEKKKSC